MAVVSFVFVQITMAKLNIQINRAINLPGSVVLYQIKTQNSNFNPIFKPALTTLTYTIGSG